MPYPTFLATEASRVRALAAFSLLASALLLQGCTGSANGFVAPCNRANAPSGCGRSCDATRICDAGLYCSSGQCTADCLESSDCSGDSFCTSDGRCVPRNPADGSVDGGLHDGALADGAGSDGSGSFDGSSGDGNICADVTVQVTPVTPNVTVIVDRSGSMSEAFPGTDPEDPSRWDAVKDALIRSSDGLIASLESQVRFGLVMYTATSEDDEEDGGDNEITSPDCPWLEINPGEIVDPDINNYAEIARVYRPATFPGNGDTPTGDSIDRVTDRVINQTNPDPNPNIFIVATDGLPDRCEDPDPRGATRNRAAQAEAVNAVLRAHGENIQTYMIWVGELSNQSVADHVQDMANAGLGDVNRTPDAPFWVAGDDDGLRTALTTIVNDNLSCEVSLNGRLTIEKACTGTVRLNGRRLTCKDSDGWDVVDETTIELLGDACDEFKTTPNASLEASFPCDAVILI